MTDLNIEIGIIKQKMQQQQQEINDLKQLMASKKPIFHKFPGVILFDKISYHQQAPLLQVTLDDKMKNNLNCRKMSAIIISVFYHHSSTNNNSHGYLSFTSFQHNDKQNRTEYKSTKYNCYANSDYVELIVPWNGNLDQVLNIQVSSSYNTEAQNNPYEKCFYTISLCGCVE